MKIGILSSDAELALKAKAKLEKTYKFVDPSDADILLALGGDGFMLEMIHNQMVIDRNTKPIYGMNRGSVGFLMNSYSEDTLLERIHQAKNIQLKPLRVITKDIAGNTNTMLAVNEISIFRMNKQAAKLKVSINKELKIDELVADGLLVSTPAGSTAYNFSAFGPILPLGTNALALTPISPFRPRRWRGAILPNSVHIEIEVIEKDKRPIAATADSYEIQNVVSAEIYQDNSININMLFDPQHNLEERILNEQFK